MLRGLLLLWVLVPGSAAGLASEPDRPGATDAPSPLRAADTSSPRDTLRTFLDDFRASVEAWRSDNGDDELRALARARDTIDFSEVPSLGRETTTVIDMALLREVLDRVELPASGDIPGDDEVDADDRLTRWVIPNTKLEIVKIADGPRAGEFLFSKETVAGLHEYYALAKDVPYQPDALVGIYADVASSPGVWVPRRFRESLPAWATAVVAGKGVWQWIALAILTLVFVPLIPLLIRTGLRWDDRHRSRSPWLRFGTPAALVLAVGLASLYRTIAEKVIGLLELPMELVGYMVLAIQAVGIAWLVFVLSNRLADAIGGLGGKDESRPLVDAALTRILFRLVSLVFIVLVAIAAADTIGIPLAPVIAGLGVGGLAIALAVRPTLENVIGGLTLFADRPVRVGDYCRYGDEYGTVEQIGLRSTRIRTLEQSLVTVPNSEFSQLHLDNFTARPSRLLQTELQIRNDTTPEQIRLLLAKLNTLLAAHAKVIPDSSYARFAGYRGSAKTIEVFAYLRCEDDRAFLDAREAILLGIEEAVRDTGAGFAAPLPHETAGGAAPASGSSKPRKPRRPPTDDD
ncbi:MAG: mechanosensitive ion channel family protein [Bauldia sp.]|nr:mechanosensitive ion channel family protein [Bauldia sp.]